MGLRTVSVQAWTTFKMMRLPKILTVVGVAGIVIFLHRVNAFSNGVFTGPAKAGRDLEATPRISNFPISEFLDGNNVDKDPVEEDAVDENFFTVSSLGDGQEEGGVRGGVEGSPSTVAKDQPSAPFIWPLPAEWTTGVERLVVEPSLTLVFKGSSNKFDLVDDAFERYRTFIFAHAAGPSHSEERVDNSSLRRLIVNISSADEKLTFGINETYYLKVHAPGITADAYLEAENVYGALRGLETFSQLCIFNLTSKSVEIVNAPWEIKDTPRFPYRGILIDTSRHYLPVNTIKGVIDSMSYAKLNVLHWHIVDSQSFPLEIPSQPKLWNGAYSQDEVYTIDDARDIVKYAQTRGVHVLPELDVPGHAESWGIGYPDLWPSPQCREPLDVSKNSTFDLIGNVLKDLRQVFPFEFIHLGGDEVNTNCWSETPHIRTWLSQNKLSPHDAYAYFVLRAQQIALSLGWDPINWNEPFDQFGGQLSPKTVVHEWWDRRSAPKAVASGLRVIVSNQDLWYLDHLDTPWERVYENEPFEGIVNSSQQQLVLGGQVCLWGETIDPSDIMQTMWPRAGAAAERLWSSREQTDKGPKHAFPRLEHFKCLLHHRGVEAAPVLNRVARVGPPGPGSCYVQ